VNIQTSPIALFCFRRPSHLEQTLAALAGNEGADRFDLIAFSDGPRRENDTEGVAAVRSVLEQWRERSVFRSFTIDAQSANLGLRRSVVRGVGRLCDEAGSVIVVEDDLVTSPYFLRYCQDGLRAYATSETVASIHGYSYPVAGPLPETFFLRGSDCWGWATWKRAWQCYNDDAGVLRGEIIRRGLERKFDLDGAYGYLQMLADAQAGRVDSWAVRWHASAFLKDMYTLHPGRSLVHNIGCDESGTHCGPTQEFGVALSENPLDVRLQPVAEDPVARAAIIRYFTCILPRRPTGLISRGWQWMKRLP
jgi:hypothetical protein